MEIKQTIIDKLKQMKTKLLANEYEDGKSNSDAFYQIHENLWSNIEVEDIQNSDLSELCTVHNYLVSEILEVREKEMQSQSDIDILKETQSIRAVAENIKDSSRVNDIYFFNNENAEYFFIGDTHSDAQSIDRVLYRADLFQSVYDKKDIRLIFLGDYVDRGKAHIKTVERLLMLKYLFPEAVYLLKGNHDRGKIEDGEVTLYLKKVEKDEDYFYIYINELSKANNTFSLETVKNYEVFLNGLTLVGYVVDKNQVIMGVHGGLTRPDEDNGDGFYDYLKSVNSITDNTITDTLGKTVEDNMLWSDPSEFDSREVVGLGRFKFTKMHFDAFTERFGIDVLIRGHEAEEKGIKEFYDGRLYTVFSSGELLEEDGLLINTETAYKSIKPKIIKYSLVEDFQLIPL